MQFGKTYFLKKDSLKIEIYLVLHLHISDWVTRAETTTFPYKGLVRLSNKNWPFFADQYEIFAHSNVDYLIRLKSSRSRLRLHSMNHNKIDDEGFCTEEIIDLEKSSEDSSSYERIFVGE